MTVGERIRERRIALGMSQEDLAAKMGYSGKSTICKAETHGDNITTTKIARYAEALNCSFDYLMGWDEAEPIAVPEYEEGTAEMLLLYSRLTKEQKETIKNMIKAFLNG